MKKIISQMALVMAAYFLGATNIPAASFTNLWSFSALTFLPGPNSDGGSPEAGLVSSGSRLYGTAAHGGTNGFGAVFAINTDGTGFANLHSFTSATEGSGPTAGLALSDGMLYGTTRAGGSNGLGTVFAVSTNGMGFVQIHSFGSRLGTYPPTGLNTNSGGAFPETDLVCSSNTLYGATEQGGGGGNGTLFKLGTDGSGFALLHNFTNDDGGYPSVHLVLSGTNLFGTTVFGGAPTGLGNGTIFRVGTDGLGFTNLYRFSSSAETPLAGLVLSGNTLYGTTQDGDGGPGNAPYGSVFKINTDGTGFTNFYILDPNLNAGSPRAGLAINGNTIYATSLGFDAYGGTVFQVNADGTGYTNLTSFNSPGDPGSLSGVLFVGGNLYCTSSTGGAHDDGTVFALILSPATTPVPLNLKLAGNTVILSWSTPALVLYSAPTLNSPFTKVNDAASPYTNVITGTQKYFRLQ